MASPYLISLQIEYPEDTPLADINVTLRQNATNESKTLTTNSDGQVQFQLAKKADFPSGYTIGDTITAYIIYQGFQGDWNYTLVSGVGGKSDTIVLIAVPSAPSLRLFAPQDFLDVLNMKIEEEDAENGVPIQQMVKIGEGAEEEIERDCNTKFDSNSGSYYTQTDYFDDVSEHRVFTPRKRPLVSITSLHYNTSRDGAADSWNTASLTENIEYTKSQDTDKIRISKNNTKYPNDERKRGWKLIYTYGRSSVPSDIKLLAIYETAIKMGYTAVVASKIGGKDISSEDFERFFWINYRSRIIQRYRYQSFVNT